MDLNRVMLIGNIVNDPEMRTIPSGQNVTSFRIATNRRWKDQSTGDYREDSQFHSVVAWGRLAEICSQYMVKGQKIYVEGRLTHRSWDDPQTGQKKYFTEIVAENVIMLSQGKGGQQGQANSQFQSQAAPSPNINQGTPADAPAPSPSTNQDDVSIPAPEQIPTIDIDENQEEVKTEDIPF